VRRVSVYPKEYRCEINSVKRAKYLKATIEVLKTCQMLVLKNYAKKYMNIFYMPKNEMINIEIIIN
jgi:hypothetical protein